MKLKDKKYTLKNNYLPIAKSLMYRANPLAKTAWVFNVAKWKRPILKKYFPQYNLRYLAVKDHVYDKHHAISLSPRPIFLIWGMIQPDDLNDYAEEFSIPIYRVEDGFIRSIGLGSNHTLPYSLCIDNESIYFNSHSPSKLEKILSTYDFNSDKEFNSRTSYCLELIRNHSISKYNEKRSNVAPMLYGPKTTKRILVLGQVEDDQSLLYGCESIRTNAELVKIAYDENPTSQIIFKTHPDVLSGNRHDISSINEIKKYAEIIPLDISLKDALYKVDHVYTQTSLGGFEALIYGVKVTTVGAPFYSGWGITDDRFKVERRGRVLSLEEIFYAAYILYPKYYDPENKKPSTLETVLHHFINELNELDKNKLSPDRIVTSYKFINYKTRSTIQSRYITHTRADNICIITDDPQTLHFAKELTKFKNKVSLIYARDSLVKVENTLINEYEQEKLEITSIHKKYGVTLSKIEDRSIKFTELLSENFKKTISVFCDQIWSDKIIETNSNGFGDFLYFEALRYNAMKEVLLEFDMVLVVQNDPATMSDIALSLAYHARNIDRESSIYYGARTYLDAKAFSDIINDSLSKPYTNDLSSELSNEDVKKVLNSSHWDIQRNKTCFNMDAVVVCGNLQVDSYAYLPMTKRVISCISNKTNKNIIYFGASFLPAAIQDESKTVTYLETTHPHFEVYDGNRSVYKNRHACCFPIIEDIFKTNIKNSLLINLGKSLPSELIKIISPRIDVYLNSTLNNFFLISELQSIFNSNSIVSFVTTMERSVISRIIAALASQYGVLSIGLQPQIISHSARYSSHSVDKMGVIDSNQIDIYRHFGASEDSLFKIGSENITSRLKLIRKAKEIQSECEYDIFFAMQHSCSETMMAISNSLRRHLKTYGGSLIVKPHPHQELSILNKVKSIFSDCENVLILSRDADTYTNLVRAKIVVGYFSSVLLEASLFGMSVIVAAFHGIHESIDFSKLGLAIKVDNDKSLSDEILSDDISTRLDYLRTSYISNNKHFFTSESQHDLIDEFLIGNIKS
ncbi:hypothetical protein ACK366_08560 [Aeromonas veronii]